MLKIDLWKDISKMFLGFIIVHVILSIYVAITGKTLHSVIGVGEFTPEMNLLALILCVIFIPVFTRRLFLKEGSEKIAPKDILKMLNGAFFLGILLGISEKEWLLLLISLISMLILGYINFLRD